MQISGETVVATSGKEDWDFVALPGNSTTWVPKWGYLTSAPTFDPRFDIGGQLGGWHYGVKAYAGYGGDVGSDKEAQRGPPVNEYCDFAGVFGTGIYVTGVAGTSVNNIGVYGQTGDATFIGTGYIAAVLGVSDRAEGVRGISEPWPGVAGLSFRHFGVNGASFMETGVRGISGGVEGRNFPNLPTTAGVFGTSGQQPGVIGTSNQNAGVIGTSDTDVGVYGASNNVAGLFEGDVVVDGNFTVVGFPGQHTKSVAVPFPDGTQRLLYCMESPEVWFEDFGAAKLKRGRVVVKIDADFAKVVKLNDYRVFATPEGDCRGLYVRKRGKSFEVRELMGGKSNIALSYRIIARRKDIKGHRRFAKIDTRLPRPAASTRAARAPTPAALRKFAASLGSDARARQAKDAMKARRLRALSKRRR